MDERPDPFSDVASQGEAALSLESLAARILVLENQVSSLIGERIGLGVPAVTASVASVEASRIVQPPSVLAPPPPRIDPEPVPEPAWARVTHSEARARASLEDRLGSQVFSLVGIVAVLFGAAWALKLAIEHGLIGPAARVVIGLVAGAGLVLWSEYFRQKAMVVFSYALKAVGTGVLYLSLWAAFQLYTLFPAPVALFAMLLVTAWNAFMALKQDAELLAGYALVGALLTPALLSSGGDHETFLFSYLACVIAVVVSLQRIKPWARLLVPTFLAMAGYFIGYYVQFFHAGRSAEWTSQSSETALFALLFFALFAIVSTRAWALATLRTGENLTSILLPLANGVFVALALYSVFEDSGLHGSLAWLMLALAAIFLVLMRLQQTALAAAMHLACAVIFLTIAIPLKLSGQALTTAWLIEGLVVFWASTRFRLESKASANVLTMLSLAGYVLGLVSVLWHWTWSYGSFVENSFFNANLASAWIALAALAGAAWLALPSLGGLKRVENLSVLLASFSSIVVVALLLVVREFWSDVAAKAAISPSNRAFANPDFTTAMLGIGLILAASWGSARAAKLSSTLAEPMGRFAASALILFNVVAVLVTVREIAALFPTGAEELARSLAISGFLMLYAAALLAIGFWKRNALVRWQALLLLVFTIAKVFLYDISGLAAGYRVVSFLALGGLLLAVSFAYQKNWLGLRTVAPKQGERS